MAVEAQQACCQVRHVFQLGTRRGQMSTLFFSQTGALTEQIQHTAHRLQRSVDLVAKGSCQTSSSSQLFCGAAYVFGSFAMREIKEGNDRRDDATFPVENWGRADTRENRGAVPAHGLNFFISDLLALGERTCEWPLFRFEGLFIEMKSFIPSVFLNVSGIREWLTQDLFYLFVGEE